MKKTMASLQAFLSFLPRMPHVLSRAQIPPSPFNACHAGYKESIPKMWTDFGKTLLYSLTITTTTQSHH